MASYNIHEAKARLSELIRRAQSGEEVVITRRNVPAVRLILVEEQETEPRPGWARGLVRIAPDFDELPPGFEDFA